MNDTSGSWRSFWHDTPGRRFLRRYERRGGHSNPAGRLLRLGLGAALVVVGVVFLALPGPGIVGILLGAGLMASESRRIAAFLDRAELALRRRFKRR